MAAQVTEGSVYGRAASVWESGRRHRYRDPLELGATIEPPGMKRGKPTGVHRSDALDVICDELVDLVDGTNDRLMIFVPPQEGKSTAVSRWLPVWLLADDPTLKIAVVSYQAQRAKRHGKWVRRTITRNPSLGISLRRDSQASDAWETVEDGGMISVGVDGGITGEPVDVLIIDDPVRGRAEAESKTYRERAWDWWENNGATRLSSRGIVILMMTRWHTDDLAGRILREEGNDWRVVSIPAIAKEEGDDPLGRRPGEELKSVQRRAPGYFHRLEAKRSPYVFASVYQQSPTAAQGNLFKRDRWRYWSTGPDQGQGPVVVCEGRAWPLGECERFGTVDLAASTKTSADYTVCAAWAILPNGDLVVLDRKRVRVAEADHFKAVVAPLQERWNLSTVYVEKSQHGFTLVYEATRAGVRIEPLEAEKDKLTRALPASRRQHEGRVWLPAGARWLDEWMDELADFPSAPHDDQVDVMAYAARIAAAYWLAPGMPAELERAIRDAGAESAEIDLLTVPY